MKKSLLALALLGAFTASAFAEPSVTLYGRIDTGLVYTHKNLDNTAGSTDTFSMDSGVTTGSRWGLKGSEDIGNAKVGFVLESGFNSDDGTSGQNTSGQNNRLFGREAQVNISSAYGTLYAGRLGSIASDNGSLGYLGDVSAFPSAYGFVGNQQGSTGTAYGRYDNTLAYQTPTFGGLQGAIMYSFKGDTKASDSNVADARENSGDADRYLAAGLRYKAGKAAVVLTGDMTMYGNDAKDYGSVDNGYSFVLGGNYDFGVAKAFAKVTYFDNQVNVLDSFDLISDSRDLKKAEALKGWGAELGTNVPAFGGNFLAAVGYRDAKDVDDGSYKFKRWNAAVGYTYAFSKRTNVYGLAGYAQEKANALDRKASGAQVGFGLVHKF